METFDGSLFVKNAAALLKVDASQIDIDVTAASLLITMRIYATNVADTMEILTATPPSLLADSLGVAVLSISKPVISRALVFPPPPSVPPLGVVDGLSEKARRQKLLQWLIPPLVGVAVLCTMTGCVLWARRRYQRMRVTTIKKQLSVASSESFGHEDHAQAHLPGPHHFTSHLHGPPRVAPKQTCAAPLAVPGENWHEAAPAGLLHDMGAGVEPPGTMESLSEPDAAATAASHDLPQPPWWPSHVTASDTRVSWQPPTCPPLRPAPAWPASASTSLAMDRPSTQMPANHPSTQMPARLIPDVDIGARQPPDAPHRLSPRDPRISPTMQAHGSRVPSATSIDVDADARLPPPDAPHRLSLWDPRISPSRQAHATRDPSVTTTIPRSPDESLTPPKCSERSASTSRHALVLQRRAEIEELRDIANEARARAARAEAAAIQAKANESKWREVEEKRAAERAALLLRSSSQAGRAAMEETKSAIRNTRGLKPYAKVQEDASCSRARATPPRLVPPQHHEYRPTPPMPHVEAYSTAHPPELAPYPGHRKAPQLERVEAPEQVSPTQQTEGEVRQAHFDALEHAASTGHIHRLARARLARAEPPRSERIGQPPALRRPPTYDRFAG